MTEGFNVDPGSRERGEHGDEAEGRANREEEAPGEAETPVARCLPFGRIPGRTNGPVNRVGRINVAVEPRRPTNSVRGAFDLASAINDAGSLGPMGGGLRPEPANEPTP